MYRPGIKPKSRTCDLNYNALPIKLPGPTAGRTIHPDNFLVIASDLLSETRAQQINSQVMELHSEH